MAKRHFITVAPEVGEMVRALANRKDMSITDLVGMWAHREYESEYNEMAPKGYELYPYLVNGEQAIIFITDGLPITIMSCVDGGCDCDKMCDALVGAAEKTGNRPPFKTKRGVLVEARRVGTGIVLQIDGIKKSMRPDIAAAVGNEFGCLVDCNIADEEVPADNPPEHLSDERKAEWRALFK